MSHGMTFKVCNYGSINRANVVSVKTQSYTTVAPRRCQPDLRDFQTNVAAAVDLDSFGSNVMKL